MPFSRAIGPARCLGVPGTASRAMTTSGSSVGSNFLVVGDDSAFEKLEGNAKQVYYFTASWCPPCKMIGPIFEKMAPDFENVQFLKIDVDENPEAAQKYGVRSVPTFLFMDDGQPEGEVVGADEGNIRSELEKLS